MVTGTGGYAVANGACSRVVVKDSCVGCSGVV